MSLMRYHKLTLASRAKGSRIGAMSLVSNPSATSRVMADFSEMGIFLSFIVTSSLGRIGTQETFIPLSNYPAIIQACQPVLAPESN